MLFAINWKTEQTDSNFASWNPFLYSSPNEFLINFVESENADGQQTMDNGQQSFVLETENLKISEPENDLESHHYYIVGGSFQTLDRAEVCLKDIRSQGFENASLLEKNDKGYIRVYYESFVEKSDALIRLDVIKNDFNESAWLLFQK